MLVELKDVDKVVILLRLSRAKAGKTKAQTEDEAYGIAAQQRMVDFALQRLPVKPKILATMVEIESGGRKKNELLVDRPKLKAAMDMCLSQKAVLVISTLDRLARNVAFISWLMESRVRFMCADDPTMNSLTAHIKAAFAEEERRKISLRVKDAMAIAKARGVKMGAARPGHFHKGNAHLRGSLAGCKAMNKAKTKLAHEMYAFLFPTFRKWQEENLPQKTMIEKLNQMGHVTSRNNPFTPPLLSRVLRRYRNEIKKAEAV